MLRWRIVVNGSRWNVYPLIVPECCRRGSMNARSYFSSINTLVITSAMSNISHTTIRKYQSNSLCRILWNMYQNGKGLHIKEIQRIIFKELVYSLIIYEYHSPMHKVVVYLLVYSKSINVILVEFEYSVSHQLLDVNIL